EAVGGSASGVRESSRPDDANRADADPEHVENRVGRIALDERTPGEHDRVDRVEYPHKEKGTMWPESAHQREAEDPHQHADHLDGAKISNHDRVQRAQ